MSITDEVHALELERDALRANLAAAQAGLDARRERGDVARDFWRSRAERAESRVVLLESYLKLQGYADQPPDDLGEWHIYFAPNGLEGAGMNFNGGNAAQMIAGLISTWIKRPGPLEIRITEPEPVVASHDA